MITLSVQFTNGAGMVYHCLYYSLRDGFLIMKDVADEKTGPDEEALPMLALPTRVLPNAEHAYKTLDQITAHPETWYQASWWCGTGGCFAGWAVSLSGLKLVQVDSYDSYAVEGGADISDTALDVLGITKRERFYQDSCSCGNCDGVRAYDLFNGSNTLEDLQRLVLSIFGPRPEVTT